MSEIGLHLADFGPLGPVLVKLLGFLGLFGREFEPVSKGNFFSYLYRQPRLGDNALKHAHAQEKEKIKRDDRQLGCLSRFTGLGS